MDINKRSRGELKAYFIKKAVPTESQFADLIEAALNQKDDGLVKLAGSPLALQATGEDTSTKSALALYRSFSDAAPDWTLSLRPYADPNDAQSGKRGFSVSTGTGVSRLFIDQASGNVGVGTVTPAARLHVVGPLRVDGDVEINGTVKGGKPPWQALTMAGGYTALGAPYAAPECSKDGFGLVRLRGALKPGTLAAGTVIATLPAGCWPAATSVHPAFFNNGLMRIEVKSTGDIALGVVATGATSITLDGIAFPAA